MKRGKNYRNDAGKIEKSKEYDLPEAVNLIKEMGANKANDTVELHMKLGVDPKPFFIAIAIAASASFMTPIGYQTNLIVQGAGGYKFTDYIKVGLPLNILFFITSVIVIPIFWQF